MATTVFKVDVSQLEDFAGRLENLSAEKLHLATIGTLNQVVDRAYVLGRERMLLGINLSDDFLQRRMEVRYATRTQRYAQITTHYGGIGVSHFRPQQTVRPAVSPVRKLKGDPPRGIALGDKQGGVSVEVTRGARKRIRLPGVFTAPNIKDTEGNPFVFQRMGGRTRTGRDRLRRLFGPSPYQLFKHQIPLLEEPVMEDMRETLLADLDEWIRKEIES